MEAGFPAITVTAGKFRLVGEASPTGLRFRVITVTAGEHNGWPEKPVAPPEAGASRW